ncbi:transposase [Streptococcus pneumoniae]|nr:transposase [Streptococcus pneumoniae]
MSRVRVQIMNQLDRKSHEYKAIKRDIMELIFV